MDKKCSTCGSFHVYYTKGVCCYIKENCGRCMQYEKICGKGESCERWRRKVYPIRHKMIALKKLDEAIDNIADIKELLYEEKR